MMTNHWKFWAALVSVFFAIGIAQPHAQSTQAHIHLAHAQPDHGHGVGDTVESDADLYLHLSMMRGHLRVGRQLLDAGNHKQAAKHFAHPAEEHYGAIAAELKRRGVLGFEGQLRHLTHTAGQGKMEEAIDLYADALGHMERASASIDAGKRASPAFVVPIVIRMLDEAAHEYEESIADERFVDVEEYQDARGFVWVGREMLGSVAADLRETDPAAFDEALAAYHNLMAAWPSAPVPEEPVMAPSEVEGLVSRVEVALSAWTAD